MTSFEASAEWTGQKAGFYFGTGDEGTGYYKDPNQLSEEELKEKMKELKEKSESGKKEANAKFSAGEYEAAIALYQETGGYAARLRSSDETDEVKAERDTFQISLFLNTAMCYLKLADKDKDNRAVANQQCGKAKAAATQAIDIKPTLKGYFRRATACEKLKQYDLGMSDMKVNFNFCLII